MSSKFLNLSTDNTLGGNNPSDNKAVSEKAIKEYVDGVTPTESTVSGWGFTKNAGTVTSVNNTSPVNGNVTISIPVVDQTYSSSSTNAQSGVAIAGAGFLTNTATGTGSLTLLGTTTNQSNSINIGVGSAITDTGTNSNIQDIITLGNNSTVTISGTDNNLKGGIVIGRSASISVSGTEQSSSCPVVIGNNASAVATEGIRDSITIGSSSSVTADRAIQIGKGTNSTASTLSIGFGSNNYQLLDGTTGLIPNARISTNIARTSAIPTVDQTYSSSSANAQSGVAIAGAGFLDNKGTGTNSLAIMGTATGNRGVGLGQAAEGTGAYSSGLGTGAKATGNYSIQIGYGTNSTASTLSVGFNASSSSSRTNWELLDGTTGLIPNDRLPVFTGADGTNAGTKGIVPQPLATDNTKFLKGDGTWSTVDSSTPITYDI